MHSPSGPIFRPSEPVIDEVLAHCADPALTLSDIALRHSTTIEALTLFIARTDIAERLESLHAAASSRARFLAANLIPMALDALTRVLRDSETEDNADAAAPPDKKRSPELRLRARETARRAATRILTLSTFNPPRLLFGVARAARPPVMRAGPAPDSSPPLPAQDAPAPAPIIPILPILPITPAAQIHSPLSTAHCPSGLPILPTHNLLDTFPGRFSGLRELPTSAITPRHNKPCGPCTAAGLLHSAGTLTSPHEHWP